MVLQMDAGLQRILSDHLELFWSRACSRLIIYKCREPLMKRTVGVACHLFCNPYVYTSPGPPPSPSSDQRQLQRAEGCLPPLLV